MAKEAGETAIEDALRRIRLLEDRSSLVNHVINELIKRVEKLENYINDEEEALDDMYQEMLQEVINEHKYENK